MPKNIVIYGGSFNPPGTHHVEIVRRLAERFDEVVVVPCGPRPDKETTNDVDAVHRAALCDMAFGGIPRVRVDLFDLERHEFTRASVLEARYSGEPDVHVWHSIGADLVMNGAQGRSPIQTEWYEGHRLWNESRFLVWEREGYPIAEADLPRNAELVRGGSGGASSRIREHIALRKDFDDMVHTRIRAHIERYGLYRGRVPSPATRLTLEEPRALLVMDETRDRARQVVEPYRKFLVDVDPNCILVAGGDGTMLRAIRQHWRLRLPFIGVNAGTRGHLLNDADLLRQAGIARSTLHVELHPMLHVEVRRAGADGPVLEALAFNDAWMERTSAQIAWMEVVTDGEQRIPRLVGDGILVATPGGSTGYATNLGAPPLPLNAQVLTLVGSNVSQPQGWKLAHLPFGSTVTVRTVGGAKRPVRVCVDGVEYGPYTDAEMHVRVSRIAAAELAFTPQQELGAKLARIQFPPVPST